MASVKTLPIACTLTPADFQDRMASIRALTRDALQSYERRDLELELRYTTDATARVREMVADEQRCCAFLDFELREEPSGLCVTITAPQLARDAADELFAQLTGRPAQES